MNRYAFWKYILIVVALVISVIYALPNLYGEAPAVQVIAANAQHDVNSQLMSQVESALTAAHLPPKEVTLENRTLRLSFSSTDEQIKARDVIQQATNPNNTEPDYVVALNLLPQSPSWLAAFNANPMYLGLDLRGGVYFMMQLDMQAVLTQKLQALVGDMRSSLRDKEIRYADMASNTQSVTIIFKDEAQKKAAEPLLAAQYPELKPLAANDGLTLSYALTPQEIYTIKMQAIKQNMGTLHNRINELGVAEPIIQQQGLDRIVVQLPGVQDTARAKDILGRTATLEVRMVDDNADALSALASTTPLPYNTSRFYDMDGSPIILYNDVLLTGENLTNAQSGFDSQTQQPAVNLTLDSKGARIFRDVTRANVGKRMAILLFENGKGQVVTAPVIRTEIDGGRVQISGHMTAQEAANTALLLRSGSLAAPMKIVEERTIGPSLGAANIAKGFHSVIWGFVVVVLFMSAYYMLFGCFSSLALAFNLLMLVAVLSMLQATLTLPGMAAMALVLGMAIDSNVLINERIREELRNGVAPQTAIHAGYDRAWATIIDSNVTTLIAGLALLAFGSGPVRGFAVVHCLGILTSMFSGVFFSRGVVNLWYGRRRKLKKLSIGTVWKPASLDAKASAAVKK